MFQLIDKLYQFGTAKFVSDQKKDLLICSLKNFQNLSVNIVKGGGRFMVKEMLRVR